MLSLLLLLLAQGSVPTLPKPSQTILPHEREMWVFRTEVFNLMQQVQTHPDFALIEHDETGATVYLKGDAGATLAAFTRNPRIRAVSFG